MILKAPPLHRNLPHGPSGSSKDCLGTKVITKKDVPKICCNFPWFHPVWHLTGIQVCRTAFLQLLGIGRGRLARTKQCFRGEDARKYGLLALETTIHTSWTSFLNKLGMSHTFSLIFWGSGTPLSIYPQFNYLCCHKSQHASTGLDQIHQEQELDLAEQLQVCSSSCSIRTGALQKRSHTSASDDSTSAKVVVILYSDYMISYYVKSCYVLFSYYIKTSNYKHI